MLCSLPTLSSFDQTTASHQYRGQVNACRSKPEFYTLSLVQETFKTLSLDLVGPSELIGRSYVDIGRCMGNCERLVNWQHWNVTVNWTSFLASGSFHPGCHVSEKRRLNCCCEWPSKFFNRRIPLHSICRNFQYRIRSWKHAVVTLHSHATVPCKFSLISCCKRR